MRGSIIIQNDKSYISIENTGTGVKNFLNKTSLVITKNNETSFQLKSESFVGNYNINDVIFPYSNKNLDELLKILVFWVQFMDVVDILKNHPPYLQISSDYDVEDNHLTTLKVVTFDPSKNMFLLQTNPNGNEYDGDVRIGDGVFIESKQVKVVRQSKCYLPSTCISSVVVLLESIITDGFNTAGVTSRVGLFDDKSDVTVNVSNSGRGIFFQFDGNGFSLVLRNNANDIQTDMVIPQSEWNSDRLDGSGPSQYTLNATDRNYFVFEWSPTKSLLRVGVQKNDKVLFCHRFMNTPLTKLNVPIRWEISHQSEISAAYQGRAIVYKYDCQDISRVLSADIGLTPKVVDKDFPMPLLTIKLKDSNNRAKFMLKSLTILNVKDGIGQWELMLNAEVGPLIFNEVNLGKKNSLCSISFNETEISKGVKLASGYIEERTIKQYFDKDEIIVSSSVEGVPELLTISIRRISGNLEVLGYCEWIEYE